MAVILGRELELGDPSAPWDQLSQLGDWGWTVGVVAAFAGGVLVIASRNGYEVRRSGESVAAVAADVVAEVRRLQGTG
jgi:hypothetical protein